MNMRLIKINSALHEKVEELSNFLNDNGMFLSVESDKIFVGLKNSNIDTPITIVDAEMTSVHVTELPLQFEFRLKLYE